jgi:hypothetical protein
MEEKRYSKYDFYVRILLGAISCKCNSNTFRTQLVMHSQFDRTPTLPLCPLVDDVSRPLEYSLPLGLLLEATAFHGSSLAFSLAHLSIGVRSRDEFAERST